MAETLDHGARRRLLEARLEAHCELERRKQAKRWREDAWEWLSDCVWTEDPHDRCFKKFPGREPWAQYLRHVVAAYCDPDVHLGLDPKARRMFLSWLHIALRVWRAAKFPHEQIYFDALKLGLNEHEPGSALEMLKRARQILEHLEGDAIPYVAARSHIDFPETQSRIVAVGSGADQLRGSSATDILMDECAFWPEAEATFNASRPTIEGFGRLWMVSTVEHGSFFSDMRWDRVGFSVAHGEDVDDRPRQAEHLDEGVVRYKNPKNGALVLEIWPHADPRKRDPAWQKQQRSGMSTAAWRREYGLDDSNVFGGTPVFDGVYDEALMAKRAPLRLDPRRPMLRSWDWGFTHPCVTVAQLYESRQLRCYASWMGTRIDLEPFARGVLRRCQERWPDADWIDMGDCAGRQQKGVGETELDLMRRKFGLVVRTRYMLEHEPLAWLRSLMTTTFRPGEPNFLVEINGDTEELRRALRGGYVLDKHGKPANDGLFEHIGDTLKYLYNAEGEGSRAQREMDDAALADVIPEKPQPEGIW